MLGVVKSLNVSLLGTAGVGVERSHPALGASAKSGPRSKRASRVPRMGTVYTGCGSFASAQRARGPTFHRRAPSRLRAFGALGRTRDVLCRTSEPALESDIMSWTPTPEPRCSEPESQRAETAGVADVELIIDARKRDLGELSVGRVLPAVARRTVGPFIFFDHMGPVDFAPGAGVDVRPHPHINLATVTYLFAGEILHRDSLGSEQVIRPGAINWMNAGRGIVHSERTPPELRANGYHLHGLQLWVALPTAHEESAPTFTHYSKSELPEANVDGATVRVLAGDAYGLVSPVKTHSRVLYVDVILPAGVSIAVPLERERAAYVVNGDVTCGGETASGGRMLVFSPGATPELRAMTDTRLVFIGGDPLDGVRHIYWNFVSSSLERLESAKSDWRERRFPVVPGDEHEFIPLPDDGSRRRAE